MAAVAAIASTTAGAPPPIWDPPDCPGVPSIGARPTGAWIRLDPELSAGMLVGQRLTVGTAGLATGRRLQLEAEAFASEPRGGTVLVGSDDGRASRLSLIDVAAGCAWSLATARDVVRSAVTTPDGSGIVEHRVDRLTRIDLGVWRRPLDGGAPTRLLAPIAVDERFGPTWVTGLGWSADGESLVVTSCGEAACRHRIVAESGGEVTTVADTTLGSFVGMADDRLIVRGACRGLPCPLVARGTGGDAVTVLEAAAGLAVMSRDAGGRSVVVHETGVGLRAIRPDGSDARPVAPPPHGMRIVPDVAWSASGAEHAPDQLVFGPDARVPLGGARLAVVPAVDPTGSVPVGEVLR
jgi:hypothetical protein